MNTDNHSIQLIETDNEVAAMAAILATKKVISFDTEFDRFWRGYGFKLFLLQIFDGEICYLVDPLKLKNLQPLWQIFENEHICKVAYACSEDIQLLKINNCFTKNIFDVQIAAKLCNNNTNSFADLMLDEFNITLDKSLQRSNWSIRPLTKSQQIYASNDVVWLLKLHQKFSALAIQNKVHEMIVEENKLCEAVPVSEYVVKLNSKQKAKYSLYHQQILLSFFTWRDEVAENYDMPPFQICTDDCMEQILENKTSFLQSSFTKGFCKRLLDDEKHKKQLIVLINNFDETKLNIPKKRDSSVSTSKTFYTDEQKVEIENKCKILLQNVAKTYGSTAAEYILRGFRKNMLTNQFSDISFRKYQQQVINKHSKELGISL